MRDRERKRKRESMWLCLRGTERYKSQKVMISMRSIYRERKEKKISSKKWKNEDGGRNNIPQKKLQSQKIDRRQDKKYKKYKK